MDVPERYLESNSVIQKYADAKITDYLPGHIREDIANVQSLAQEDMFLLEYLTDLLKKSEQFWKGKRVTLAYLAENFPTKYVLSVAAGAGAFVASDNRLTYTEDATPSGAFTCYVTPVEYFAFRFMEAWVFEGNQDAGVTISLATVDDNKTWPLAVPITESLDNAYKARSTEMSDVSTNEIHISSLEVVRFKSTAEIDASTPCHAYIPGLVI